MHAILGDLVISVKNQEDGEVAVAVDAVWGTGLNDQYTPMAEPMMAIHTTLTAAGTLTRGSEKWRVASRNPKAEDFMAVSMAVVRATTCKPQAQALRLLGPGYAQRVPRGKCCAKHNGTSRIGRAGDCPTSSYFAALHMK